MPRVTILLLVTLWKHSFYMKAIMKTGGLDELILALQVAGVTLYGDLKAADILKLPKASSFHHEYS